MDVSSTPSAAVQQFDDQGNAVIAQLQSWETEYASQQTNSPYWGSQNDGQELEDAFNPIIKTIQDDEISLEKNENNKNILKMIAKDQQIIGDKFIDQYAEEPSAESNDENAGVGEYKFLVIQWGTKLWVDQNRIEAPQMCPAGANDMSNTNASGGSSGIENLLIENGFLPEQSPTY